MLQSNKLSIVAAGEGHLEAELRKDECEGCPPFPIYACCSSIIINVYAFHSQKYP